ncbi:hypothetical protein OG948_17010 [Embleya sp. NBC_00888]|uniref:hypothetical protein n=1 Tax=Embleya sp. NBC_00888 TaxID=2975960 RepID=UPI003866532E|nr:hypothetical protein OG948_17010 [Embleya sp. NBC_00888]
MDPSTKSTHIPLTSSIPLFDSSRLPLRTWCADSREDPLTGLVAFPDFHSNIPRELAGVLVADGLVALAIGDVDGLKEHVETTNASDPACYGHLAGNRVMARLGAVSREWFAEQTWEAACVATFGGDEVIIAAAIEDPDTFHRAIGVLRDRLAAALPTPVSFALTVAGKEHLPPERNGNGWKHTFTDSLLGGVDRCLFTYKAARRTDTTLGGGTIAVAEPPTGWHHPTSRTLLSLPERDETLHVIARPAADRRPPALLLPCNGPAGLRGRRFRVTRVGLDPTTEVVVSLDGQAALPFLRDDDAGGVAVVLRPMRDGSRQRRPLDLIARLAEAGLDWSILPLHEQAQMLHLIRESADADIRDARIAAAVQAVRARRPR